jgi:Zn-dependent peptidase ImmA (M78 family)
MATLLDNELLKLARNYTGLNQKSFAEKINISQSLISNIEKGIKPLNTEIIENLKEEFGSTFFYQKIQQAQLKVYYRASATIAKKYTDLFEARLQIISNNITTILERVDIPENNIPFKDLEDYGNEIEHLANEIRDYFNLGRKPIEDVVRLLERNGVIIFFFDFDFISAQNKNFDGVSFYVKGVPVMLINNKIQNARKVFTICHELCHLICHNHSEIFISKDRDIEKEANQFASEFIAPKSALRGEFARLSLDKLFQLKAYWKLSAGALLYKAKQTTLTDDQYRRWITMMSPFRKFEPHDFEISEPILLKKMFDVFEENLDIDENFYDSLGLSKKIFSELYSYKDNVTSKQKVRIIV